MKKVVLVGVVLLMILSLSACAAGPNELSSSEYQVGFWQGVWHGFIALFSFVVSLFNENVGIYEVHNSGNWYNFGFILGVMMFFGGGGKSQSKSWKRH